MPVIDIIQKAIADFGCSGGSDVPAATVAARLRHVVQKLNGLGIKTNYDPVPAVVEGKLAEGPTRVLLYSSRYNSRNFAVAAECNGIIFDYVSWRCVYRPPELPNAQFSVSKVEENWAEYDVFDLNDGTVVGLYYYQDKWRIATARGLDMGAVSWCGVTYQAAIEAAMEQAKFPTPADREAATAGEIATARPRPLEWRELDVDVSYTVGFTHPKMHFSKFLGMWLIRARPTAVDGHVTSLEDGKSTPTPYNFMSLDLQQFEMPVQRQVSPQTFPTFRSLQQLCQDPKAVCWGFMLRSRNPSVTGADSTVLVESRRMNLVRDMVYDRHRQQEADAFGVTRDQLAFTECLLSENLRESYIQLWPAHAERQQRALAALDELATQVLSSGKKKDTASWFRSHILRTRPLTGMTRTQVADFMLQRQHLSILLQFLRERELLA